MERAASLKILVTAGALVAGAVALWLSAVSAGDAATATAAQGTTAQAPKQISWATGGTSCTNIPSTTAAFGEVEPGANKESSTFTGCVKSNAAWSVSAEGTAAMASGGNTIPNSNLRIKLGSSPSGASNTGVCDAYTDDCTLNAARTLFTGATGVNTGQGASFTYTYQLSMPADQPAGEYTGGQVTFTASN